MSCLTNNKVVISHNLANISLKNIKYKQYYKNKLKTLDRPLNFC